MGEASERNLEHLHRAEPLVQTLGDQRRLGWVYGNMNNTFWVMGEVESALDYGQGALAVVDTLGDVGLQAWARLSLARIYADVEDYARAVERFARNVAALDRELRYERFGTNGSVAASSRAQLSLCHAERGAFTEGLAMAEEGLRIAEAVNHPFRLIEASYGLNVVYGHRGEVPRAIPGLERAMSLCQDWDIPLLVPITATALGVAYALEGRTATGLALVEHEVEQQVARGRSRLLALVVSMLSEAYLLAGRLEDARQRAAQAVALARHYRQRGWQAWALWLLGESTARQASPAADSAEGHYRQTLALNVSG